MIFAPRKIIQAADRDLQDLAYLYGKACDATQELAFVVAKMPFHFRACGDDLKRGKPVSVENVEHHGKVLKARANAALKAIGALHALAERYSETTATEREAA